MARRYGLKLAATLGAVVMLLALPGCASQGVSSGGAASPVEMLRDCQKNNYPGECVDKAAQAIVPGATYENVVGQDGDYGTYRQFTYTADGLNRCETMTVEYPAAPTGPKVLILFQSPGYLENDCGQL
jgi:hypothetical protein